MRTLTLIISVLLISFQVGAAEKAQYELTVRGKLVSYNPKTVTILTDKGGKIKVPRNKVFPKPEGVIVGKAQVLAKLSPKEMFELNPVYKKLALKVHEKKVAEAQKASQDPKKATAK